MYPKLLQWRSILKGIQVSASVSEGFSFISPFFWTPNPNFSQGEFVVIMRQRACHVPHDEDDYSQHHFKYLICLYRGRTHTGGALREFH